MRFLSVCSGIETASVAWEPLGWKAAAFSEIEKFPSAVLAHHYPDTPNLGDMTKFEEWPDLGPIDLVCGGTPCQAFSVAGLRKGLSDPRGNLAITFLAIVDKLRPRWVVWENVPGVFSATSHNAPDPREPKIDLDSDDAPGDGEKVMVSDEYDADENHAFSCFLAGLSELGYGWAYRVLDAQYCRVDGYPEAVPQRRRRVFLVGYLGDWRHPAAVLFEPKGVLGNTPPRRQAREAASRGVAFGPHGGSFAPVSPTLDTRAKDGPIRNQLAGAVLETEVVRKCLTRGASQRMDAETETFVSHTLLAKPNASLAADLETYVAHTLKGEGFDASEDGTGRGTPIIPAAYPLTAGMAASASRMPHEQGALVPIAFDCKGTEVQCIEDGSHPTLRSMGHSASHQNAGGHAAVCQSHAVRRLTPTECERLQGLPDGHTQIPYRGKPAEECPDGPRYKAIGNAWSGNVTRWLGKRIQIVEEVMEEFANAS